VAELEMYPTLAAEEVVMFEVEGGIAVVDVDECDMVADVDLE